mgnify:FL=1
MDKLVYLFLPDHAEGSKKDLKILGGKGANLAEMCNLSIPVPPGFTISTKVCTYYMKTQKYPPGFKKQVNKAIQKIENEVNKKFGNAENPLLLSVRSGAPKSMPGMMETVLNVGLTKKNISGLIKQTDNSRFVYDAYRRLLMMYSDVVMEQDSDSIKIRLKLEKILNDYKHKHNIHSDDQLSKQDLIIICSLFQKCIKNNFSFVFPDDSKTQLWGAIEAVLKSWNCERAVKYRKIENISHDLGTAVNVQCMVFGNLGTSSATGVGFTRNPSSGEKKFFGEWLQNAQGEDVVAGIRTPNPISGPSKLSLEYCMPEMYKELNTVQKKLENHYNEMQDIEFTIENNKLWLLQTRNGKRNGLATIKIALDMMEEKMHSSQAMLNKILPHHINEILLPTIDYSKSVKTKIISRGLPAGPGCATGQVVFSPEDASMLNDQGKQVILVREETSPEDVQGMFVSNAILTTKGGMTSHAALVARGWGKCCVVGCNAININLKRKEFYANHYTIKEGDWITLDGSKGIIYTGKLDLVKPKVKNNTIFNKLLKEIAKLKTISVRANADRKKDSINAINLGAEGIGLCRTEHMFFEPNRVAAMRKMILSTDVNGRRNAIMELLPYQKNDFYKILKAMNGMPVTIRLLDPPLHEFLPNQNDQIIALSKELNISASRLRRIIDDLSEANPMLGHRGCRLAISFPEITEMQTEAIVLATVKLLKEGFSPIPEIMIPLVGNIGEFLNQKQIIESTIQKLNISKNINIKIGTMIELPRACFIADEIAKHADFISFGTNDLTQTTFGFSRDDIGSFLPHYIENNIINKDPFQTLDTNGVGELIKIAIKKSKTSNPNIKIGVCGEHGGDPESIKFLVEAGVHYVSCSPFRIPIAGLTLAQTAKK